MTQVRSQCLNCRHLFPRTLESGAVRACTAFPDSIPSAIFANEHDHANPYPGDHGVTFEALPGRNHVVVPLSTIWAKTQNTTPTEE